MKYSFEYKSIIGNIVILSENEEITNIYLNYHPDSALIIRETPAIRKTYTQINEYLQKKRKYFDVPLKPHGTIFMKKVWKELRRIPFGETRTYKDIAEAVNHPKAYRAVGLANNKNPIPIIIPCHRVIGSNGNLIGYAGGLELKKFLIDIER